MNERRFAILLAVALGCFGCGGGGGTAQSNNTFAGTYAGEYVDQNGFAGEIQITVSSSGSLVGTYTSAQATKSLISGQINASGNGNVTIPNGTASVQIAQSGPSTTSLAINPSNKSNPNALAVFVSGGIVYLPLNNAFTGSYTGTLRDTTLNTASAVAMVINASGTVSGSEVMNISGSPTLTAISGSVAINGALSLTTQANPITVSGTLIKGVAVYGPLQLSNGDTGSITLTPTTSSAPPP